MPHFDVVHADATPYGNTTVAKRPHTKHEIALRITLVDREIFPKQKFSFINDKWNRQ